jgi:hypothetical protein
MIICSMYSIRDMVLFIELRSFEGFFRVLFVDFLFTLCVTSCFFRYSNTSHNFRFCSVYDHVGSDRIGGLVQIFGQWGLGSAYGYLVLYRLGWWWSSAFSQWWSAMSSMNSFTDCQLIPSAASQKSCSIFTAVSMMRWILYGAAVCFNNLMSLQQNMQLSPVPRLTTRSYEW